MAYTDYLPTYQADYVDQIFTLRPNKSIEFSFDKPTAPFMSDGNIEEVVDLADYFDVMISVNYNTLTETSKDFILDLYADLYKADGLNKSFLFKHPTNDEYYVCKFLRGISETMQRNFRHSYGGMSFLSLGTDRNLISTSSWVVGNTTATGYSAIDGSGGGSGYDTVFNYDEVLDYEEVL